MTGRGRDERGVREYADLCLMHLVSDPALLAEFMTITGYDGAGLRAALESESLHRGLIDYVASNEPVMLSMCANAGIRPEQFMAVWQRLNHAA